jgi:hypothetical protein
LIGMISMLIAIAFSFGWSNILYTVLASIILIGVCFAVALQ